MAVELLSPLVSRKAPTPRPGSAIRPSRLVVMSAGLPSHGQTDWLEGHLADRGHGLDPWCVMLGASGEREPEPAELDELAAAVGARGAPVTRRVLVGDLRVSLEAMAEGAAVLPVLLDDPLGPLTRWGLRRASHPVLVLPPRPQGGRPRVKVVAEQPDDLGWLATWATLMPAGTAVELVSGLDGLEDGPPVACLRRVRLMESALAGAVSLLAAAGLQVVTRPGTVVSRPQAPTLLICPASTGLLRRWLPGAAERALAAGATAVLAVPRPVALGPRPR